MSSFAEDGFLFVRDARAAISRAGSLDDWRAFSDSWQDLCVDTYLAQAGRARRRRHAVYSISIDGVVVREPHQPHHQDLAYNPLQGGIDRWFEPVVDAVAEGPSMRTLIAHAHATFAPFVPGASAWRAEVHQMRIEAQPGAPGYPTPEGVHRDGVDYVMVLLVARHNIVSGTTTVFAADGRLLGDFTLTSPFDVALLDDARVWHGVTAVEPLDPRVPAYRDVLVLTLKARRELAQAG